MLVLALACAGPAVADFGDFGSPGAPDPADSPRVDTPNDDEFDRCEPDDEELAPDEDPPCDSYFSEDYRLFGFRADSARNLSSAPLEYSNCEQLDA